MKPCLIAVRISPWYLITLFLDIIICLVVLLIKLISLDIIIKFVLCSALTVLISLDILDLILLLKPKSKLFKIITSGSREIV